MPIKLLLTSSLVFTGCLAITANIALLGYFNSITPLNGWDTLHFWGETASKFLNATSATDFLTNYENRHPPLVVLLLASSQHLPLTTGLPWFLAVAAPCLCSACLVLQRNLTRSWILFGMIGFTVPLISNHAGLFGYTETILGSLIALSVYFFLTPKRSTPLLLAASTMLFLAGFTKNTAYMYVCLTVLCMALAEAEVQYSKRAMRLAGIAAILLSAAAFKTALHFAGGEFVFNAFGYELIIRNPNFAGMLDNLINSRFVKLSYTIVPLWALFFVFSDCASRSATRLLSFLFWFILLGELFLVASQTTTFGYLYATPNNDSSYSRFSVPVYMIITMLAPAATAELLQIKQRSSRRNSTH